MPAVVVTVFSVILTRAHVVVFLRVVIVETGTSLMERDCYTLEVAICMRAVYLRELTYVEGTMLTHQLVSIAVISQLMLSMMMMTSQ